MYKNLIQVVTDVQAVASSMGICGWQLVAMFISMLTTTAHARTLLYSNLGFLGLCSMTMDHVASVVRMWCWSAQNDTVMALVFIPRPVIVSDGGPDAAPSNELNQFVISVQFCLLQLSVLVWFCFEPGGSRFNPAEWLHGTVWLVKQWLGLRYPPVIWQQRLSKQYFVWTLHCLLRILYKLSVGDLLKWMAFFSGHLCWGTQETSRNIHRTWQIIGSG